METTSSTTSSITPRPSATTPHTDINAQKLLKTMTDATVSLISDQNQTLATGHTDVRGLWTFHDLAKLTKAKKHPWMITVQKGNDYSFLIFGKTEVDVSPFDVAGDRVAKDGYSAF